MIEEKAQLPKGWIWTRIREICSLINGRAFKPTEWSSKGLPIIRIQNLNDPEAEFNYCEFNVDNKYYVNDGQLLFAWSGTPETSFGAHIWNRGKAVLNQHIFKVEINENYINKIFFKYLINHNISEYVSKAHGTAGLAHITKSKFDESLIPLPPFTEQSRISDKIEELFTQLDAGVDSLKKVKAQLKRYRQAFLKYAFEGRLTEEWRKTHRDEIEPASKLLERIREERKRLGKYEEPQPIDTTDFLELPESWIWTKLGTICETTSGGTPSRKNKTFYGGGIPWLKSGELDNRIIDSTEETITTLGLENSSAKIFPKGTLLIALYGATVGKLGILGIDATTNQAVCAIFMPSGVSQRFLFWFLNSYRNELLSARIGGAQPNISQSIVNNVVLPLAPFHEQRKIVEEIEYRLSIADNLERVVEQNLILGERMRQSILKRAFEGRLVPQDPSDEPAERLLERIREERARYRGKENTVISKAEGSLRQMGLMNFVK
ncbi:MAG: restriction endonuclease subunit S [Candidatus Bathyarchaeota archaeon]